MQPQDGQDKIGGGTYHENDALKEFSVSKSDPKYQTLPYNTKFTVNLLPNRISRGENLENGEIKDGDHLTNANLQTHMTVHSAPLNIINKNIATPLNQIDLLGKRQSEISNGPVQNGITYQVSCFKICTSLYLKILLRGKHKSSCPLKLIVYSFLFCIFSSKLFNFYIISCHGYLLNLYPQIGPCQCLSDPCQLCQIYQYWAPETENLPVSTPFSRVSLSWGGGSSEN